MVIYIDRKDVPDVENIDDKVFKYLIEKAKAEQTRYDKLYAEYIGKTEQKVTDDEIKLNINYCKYVVNMLRGFFLGEPIKYDNNKKTDKKTLLNSVQKEVSVKNGRVVAHEWDKVGGKEIDITPIIEVYDNQEISEIDSKIGKFMIMYGNTQELLYASDDKDPVPKSAAIEPQNCILVRDNSVEHRDIFFMTYEERERINRQKYYAVTVYSPKTQRYYESQNLETFKFSAEEAKPHYFGDVPCVNYDNDEDRQGDIEQIAYISKAYSQLMSDRLTDKKKFIDAILAIYGFTLPDGDSEEGESTARKLKDNKLIDGIPIDAKIEYIQKVFDEASVKILGDDLIRDLHKISMTVDMSDEAFSGNITGVALSMKFMPMLISVKPKIRNMDKGLKRRFELYNNWLVNKKIMDPISKNDIDVVFTIDMPTNLNEMVGIVEKLEGRVDEQTLLALLPFVKDPAEMAEIMKKLKQENKKQFLDSFGKKDPNNIDEGEEEQEESEENINE